MKRLIFSTLFAITLLLTPVVSFASAEDLTPSQYAFSKQWASDFCEARDDGLTI